MQRCRVGVVTRTVCALAVHKHLLIVTLLVLGMTGCASQGGLSRHSQYSRDTHGRSGQAGSNDDADAFDDAAGGHAASSGQRALAQALERYYERWAGTPYEYGGRNQYGIDCSSFVRHTISAVDSYELPRTTLGQAQIGEQVSRSRLSTGDLVFFKTGSSSHHVGIYLGHGRFMHASTSDGVTISSMDDSYWRSHYWQSRRVIASTN